MEGAVEAVRPLTGLRAVLVDDDQSLLNALTRLLRDAGCEVTAFDRFEDAKRHLASIQVPDVLITDVRLGAFNGLQLALMRKVDHPEMTTVVLTGYDDPVLRKDAEAAGALYVNKATLPSGLIEALRRR
jgi:DNA-binding NtrC family response regulator